MNRISIMSAAATNRLFLEVYEQPEKEKNLNLFYSNYNTKEHGGLTAEQLQSIYERLRNSTLSMPQIKASMKHVCSGYPDILECDEEELLDVLDEMDRRCFLAKDLQWEFAMLDRQGKGSISKSDVMFLFKMVHGEYFSQQKFNLLMNSRIAADSDITFQEIEVELCNIPTYQWVKEKLEAEKKMKEKELEEIAKAKQAEQAKQANIEKRRKQEELKQLQEEKRKQQELERIEKEKKEQELLKMKQEKLNKENEERLNKEQEQRKKEEAEKLKRAEEERRIQEEAEKKAEKERRKQKEEERRLQEVADKLKKENEERLKKEEEGRLKKEEAEKLKQEKEEEERKRLGMYTEGRRPSEENQRKIEDARKNWKKLKNIGHKQLLSRDLEALRAMKRNREANEAAEEENTAEALSLAEAKAEKKLQKAEESLKNATTEEEMRKAEKAKEKATREALANKEKRLRLQLTAAVKLRNRPKIDINVEEAKEAEIPALNPDIEIAEKVSDSLKCGEDLEDALVKRDLTSLEEAVSTIKTKKYEKDHVVQLLEAEKLMDKLRRLEKSKKDILELNQRTIAEIRSYSQPILAIHEIMIATYMILGYKNKELKQWKYVQALLGRTGKESLKRMCTTLEPSKIDLNIAKTVENKYLNKYTLEAITDISAGIGTFYKWSTVMIEEARNWNEDGEMRKKIEEKRKLEMEEAKKLNTKKKKPIKRKSIPSR